MVGIFSRSGRSSVRDPRDKDTQKHLLGNSGLEVSAIGFGCMALNFGFGIDPETSR